jgi:hypothetical protein
MSRSSTRSRLVVMVALSAAFILGVGVVPINADEVRLIDDSVVRGTIVKRIGTDIVFEVEGSGRRDVFPPAIIKAIRVTGSSDWMSPREFFGGDLGNDDDALQDPSPGDEPAEQVVTPDADAPRMSAHLLRIDMAFDGKDVEQQRIIADFFMEVSTDRPDGIIVLVEDVSMSPEATLALARHLQRLDPDVTSLAVIAGRTSDTVLPLLDAADRVAWLPEGSMRLGGATPESLGALDRLRRRIGGSNVERLLSGTPLTIDENGSLAEARGSRGFSEIDADVAVRCGLADGRLAGAGSKELAAGIEQNAFWRVSDRRLATLIARIERDQQQAAQQLVAASDAAREIGEYAAKIRSEATVFDELYEDYHIDLVWSRQKEWRHPDHKLKSVRQQREVRNAIQGLRNSTARLKVILSRIPTSEPKRRSLDACLEAATAATERIREYDAALQRNADKKYEATRAQAKGLRVGGC